MFNSRYSLTSDTATSKITGNVGSIIMGWSLGLPEQAHKLILSNSSEKLKKENKFFLPYERFLSNDKLLSDLRFSKSICVIPIYFDSLPKSESVFALSSVSLKIPLNIDIKLKKDVRKIKQDIIQLYSVKKENVLTFLNTLKYDYEDLYNDCSDKKYVEAKLFCLEYPSGLLNDFYFAFVFVDFLKDGLDENKI